MVLRCENMLLHSPPQRGQVELFSLGRQSTSEKKTLIAIPPLLPCRVCLFTQRLGPQLILRWRQEWYPATKTYLIYVFW